MRAPWATVALAGALGLASCDFDFAYEQFCEGNPACADAGADAAVAPADAAVPDASGPDASPDGGPPPKPCVLGRDPPDCPGEFCQNGFCVPIQCDPTDTTFSVHDGPSNCWYGQICAEQGTCQKIETNCGPRGTHEDPMFSGPMPYDVTTSTEADPLCPDPVIVVDLEFYAPHGVFQTLKVQFRAPPGLPYPPCETRLDEFAGYTWGGIVANVCCPGFNSDPTGWALGLSDNRRDFTQANGAEYCFP